MRNWWVGRHNEVYRIANAHNWPCLAKYDKCAWALGREVFWACLKIVGAVMSMCVFAKKLSLSNLRDDLKSLSDLSLSTYFNQKSRISALCAWYRQHLAILMKTSLKPQDLRKLFSIPMVRVQFLHEWSECCLPSGNLRTHLDYLMETPALEKWRNWQLSNETFQFGLYLNVMTLKHKGKKQYKSR